MVNKCYVPLSIEYEINQSECKGARRDEFCLFFFLEICLVQFTARKTRVVRFFVFRLPDTLVIRSS